MVMTSSFVLLVCNALTPMYGAVHVVGGRVVVAVEDRHRFIHIKADNNIMLLEGLIFLKRQVVDTDRTADCDAATTITTPASMGGRRRRRKEIERRPTKKKRFSYSVGEEEDLINGASVNNV